MKIKKILKQRKSPYGNHNPRVRNSYYTFSKEYPAGNIPLERRIHHKFKSEKAKRNVTVLALVLIVCFSFFFVRLLLDISHKAPSEENSTTVSQSVENEEVQSILLSDQGFRALYMPYEHLGDTSYIRSFIKKIERKDCNAVIIDFKTENGKLCYSSLNNYAITGRCAVFNNNTVRQALSLFKKANVTVAARIFCFLDNTIPVNSPGLAVKYMDTDVNWIDTTYGEDGKTWLNPCSKKALYYLLDIIEELQSFNIDGFILEKCHFPDSDNTGGASFPGEKNFKNKNDALKKFIKAARKKISDDRFLIITQSATDSLNGNKKIYHGKIGDAAFDGIAAYTLDRPESYVLDKKTDFISMIGLINDMNEANKEKSVIPVIDISEYSRKYMRTVKKNCRNFILFDPMGEY